MIRLLLRIFGIKDYEVCASCETLKQQLLLVNAEKKELTETLVRMINPKVVQSPTMHVPNFKSAGATFSQRRAKLEEQFSAAKEVRERSPFIAQPTGKTDITPESIEEMKEKLGLNEKENAS